MTRRNATPVQLRSWSVRGVRAGLLLAILLVVRFQGGGAHPEGAEIALEHATRLFPDAVALRPGDDLTSVLGKDEALLGFVIKTLPRSASVVGYAGPSDVLVALDPDGSVLDACLL